MSEESGQDIVVFLGPTLSAAEAAGHLKAVYLPPAEQGCVVKAMRAYKPRALVLIDGAFGQVPAVRHKEILYAMSEGVSVFGAASMGALRAAELSPAGMVGHGLVYRWYRLTPFADDDEVAVAMTPPEVGAEALGEALINIRLTLRRAAREGILPKDLRRGLEALARAMPFRERSYDALLAGAYASLPSPLHAHISDLERWLPDHAVDQKRADAVGLLRALATQDIATPNRPAAPFRMTEAFAADLAAFGLLPPDGI